MERLTVSEFAKRAGVSRQAIYKQLSTDSTKLSTELSTYSTKVDNRIMLDIKALELFAVDSDSTKLSTDSTKVVNQVECNLTTFLQETIESLQEQLKEKDRQLAEKDKQLERLDKKLENSQNLQGREQDILGRLTLALEDKQKSKKWYQIWKKEEDGEKEIV